MEYQTKYKQRNNDPWAQIFSFTALTGESMAEFKIKVLPLMIVTYVGGENG